MKIKEFTTTVKQMKGPDVKMEGVITGEDGVLLEGDTLEEHIYALMRGLLEMPNTISVTTDLWGEGKEGLEHSGTLALMASDNKVEGLEVIG